MNLNEVLSRYGERPERQLDGKITEGKRIDLAEFSKALADWQKIYDQLNPFAFDKRRHREQRRLEEELCNRALILRNISLKIKVNGSKSFTRECLLRANPSREAMVKDIFSASAFWLPICYAKLTDGSVHAFFCHANTKEISELIVDANSPAAGNFGFDDPVDPRGEVVNFSG